MVKERSPILPSELLDLISQELVGKDLFYFTLATYKYLNISSYQMIRLLDAQKEISLADEIKALIAMPYSTYTNTENGITVMLSSYEWSNMVQGAFKLSVIEKSLKYFSTTVFFTYARLWSFNPFYYNVCYPTLEIFDYPYVLQQRPLSDYERILFTVWETNSVIPNIVVNFTQFLSNYTSRYEYDVWGPDIDWNLFIIAGGSVISSLLVKIAKMNASDVDLFFLEADSNLFTKAVNELETKLHKKYYVRRKTIWPKRLIQFDLFRKFNIQHVFENGSPIPSIIIQIIRPITTRSTISTILHSFDLDICAAAFNSTQVIISFGCLQALNTGYTTCYANLNCPTQFFNRATRLLKYQQRGFNILCPKGFNISEFLATNIHDCQETYQKRTYRFRKERFGDNCDSFKMQKQFCDYFKLN